MWYKILFLILAATTIAAAVPLAEPPAKPDTLSMPKSLFEMEHNREVNLLAAMEGGVATDSVSVANPNKPNIGKALLLSAIVPGTGQLYLGEKLKGYIFLGIEAAAWTMALSYTVQGNNADRDFKHFVDVHWNETAYRDRIFYYATLETLATRQSNPPFEPQVTDPRQRRTDWDLLPWSEKSQYLPSNFTHELPASKDQQYYEMVGKYWTQFGFAWDDWNTTDSTGGVYRGFSSNANHYEDMRYTSNQLLKKGNTFMMIATLNHVLSVADAIFTIHSLNNATVSTAMRIEQRTINNEIVTMPTLHIRF